MKIPLKAYLLYCISTQSNACSYKEIMPLIEKEYPNERQITKKNINQHLESLRVVGALETVDAFEEDGDFILTYQIASYGLSLLKYVKIKENGYAK